MELKIQVANTGLDTAAESSDDDRNEFLALAEEVFSVDPDEGLDDVESNYYEMFLPTSGLDREVRT